jgi:uncharacterized protein YjiS (DUF1127 family)
MQSTILSDASGVSAPQSEAALLPRAISAFVGILKRTSEHRRIKIAQWRLSGMSDRELKDIGLTRVGIFSAVRGPTVQAMKQTVDMGEGNRRPGHAPRLDGPASRSEPRLTVSLKATGAAPRPA